MSKEDTNSIVDNEMAVVLWNNFGYLRGRGIDAHLTRYRQIIKFLREQTQEPVAKRPAAVASNRLSNESAAARKRNRNHPKHNPSSGKSRQMGMLTKNRRR